MNKDIHSSQDTQKGQNLSSISAEEKLLLLKKQLMKRANRETASFNLSFGQKALWFIQQSEPEKSTYNEALAVKITSEVNGPALKKSFQRLLNRHSILRTSYVMKEGKLSQQVRGFEEICFEEIEARGWDDAAVRAKALELYHIPFNLESGPVMRVYLFKRGAKNDVLLIVIHHICCDGWSMMVLMEDLKLLYSNETQGIDAPLPPLSLTYADFVKNEEEILSGSREQELWNYWSSVLSGELPLLQLPADRPRPTVKTDRGSSKYFKLDPEVTRNLKELSKKEGTSLYVTLLAAFQVVLHKFSGQEDIIVGTPMAGRNKAAYENMMGYFVNPVAIRGNLEGDPGFLEFQSQIRKSVLGALSHQEYPFPLLVEKLNIPRDVSRTPVFQAMFFLQTIQQYNTAAELIMPGNEGVSVKFGNLDLEYFHFPHKEGRFDVTLELIEGKESVSGIFKYNTDLFDASTIERIISGLKMILKGIVKQPDSRISELSLLNEEQKNYLIHELNATGKTFEGKQLIHELFEEQAALYPKEPAVVYEDKQLSYQELNSKANQLARYLRKEGAGPEVLIGICLERSVEMMVSILAVLKANSGYVPIDPSFPSDRIRYMMENSGMKGVVTSEDCLYHFENSHIAVVCVDKDADVIKKENTGNLENTGRPENPVYVIYTSGSTGRPKGVCVEQRQLVNYVKGVTERLELPERASYATVSTFAADLGNTVIFPSLCTGGCLHILSRERVTDPVAFAAYMRKHRVECIKITPSHMEAMMNIEHPSEVLPAKRLIFGGESCSSDLIEKVEKFAPECEVFNHYGPTETTVGVITCKISGKNYSRIPLGRPIPNLRIYLLDKYKQPVPSGVAGELYIGGAGVTRGYLSNESLTSEKFLPDPFLNKEGERMYRTGDLARYLSDGSIEFLGRADNQVKIRGYRIELGEIESAILEHESIKNVVVTTYENKTGKNLAAYLVTEHDQPLHEKALRLFLEAKLPGYMLPQVFVVLEKLPLTPNGKIDYRALPSVTEAVGGLATGSKPSNETEEMLAGIWSDVLGRTGIGIHDHFFHIGGHSLLATQVISRIRSVFAIDIPVHRLFISPTISELSEYIRSVRLEGNSMEGIKPVTRGNNIPLSFSQQRLWFVDQLNGQSSLYNMTAVLKFEGKLEVNILEQAVNEVFRRHEILRTNFLEIDELPVQNIRPEVRLTFPVTDLSGNTAEKRAAEVDRLISEEASSPFDLRKDVLLRISLVRLAADEHLLMFTMHHIISDRWSIGILIKEVSELYRKYHSKEFSSLPSLPVQYADFALWQKEWMSGKNYSGLYDYWKSKLQGMSPLLELPADFPRPAMSSLRGSAEKFELDETLTEELNTLTRKAGATMYMTLLAAYSVLLSKYSGVTDMAIGSIIANRNRKEIESLIGFFANTLIFRNDLSGNPSFRELLERVRVTSLDAYAHQDFPFEKLVEELRPERNLSYAPLVQVMFNYKNITIDPLELPDLKISYVDMEKISSKYDLSLVMEEKAGGMAGAFEYSSDLFKPSFITRMIGHFNALLKDLVSHPDKKLSEIVLVDDKHKDRMEEAFMMDLDEL